MALKKIGTGSPLREDSSCFEPRAMPLDALRDAKQLTQVQMAQLLKISQGAVSKVERRTDMFISTLRNYVRAIGGDLEIRAVFPEGDVLIDQFGEARPPRACRTRAQRREREERKTAAVSFDPAAEFSMHQVGIGRILARASACLRPSPA